LNPTNLKATRLRLSVVIPCFNEIDGIGELYRRVTAVCRGVADGSYEIVLVNDGSTDGTRESLRELCRRDEHLVLIDLSRNYGHQIALTAGLELCRGERILVLDADLQDPPELLPEMMARMDEGHDVVYGQRVRREGESWFKKSTASVFYRLLSRMADIEIARDTGDFRLMSRRALDQLNAMPERYRFIRGMVSWIGFSQAALPYVREPRFAGKTKYPVRRMVALALDAITGFSIVPLRFASHLGFAFGLLGILALGWTLYGWLAGDVVEGWTSLASVVLILGSVQLFVLGIFGEYLGRMYMEAKGRPLYVVSEIVTSGALQAEADAEIHEPREMAGNAERA
jgi:dolichol-phosphate mannosyltransferase